MRNIQTYGCTTRPPLSVGDLIEITNGEYIGLTAFVKEIYMTPTRSPIACMVLEGGRWAEVPTTDCRKIC